MMQHRNAERIAFVPVLPLGDIDCPDCNFFPSGRIIPCEQVFGFFAEVAAGGAEESQMQGQCLVNLS